METMETYGAVVNAAALKVFLKRCFQINENETNRSVICIWGPAGIGKTSIVKQFKEEGYQIVDIPIAQFEEMGDFHGLPVTENIGGTVVTVTAPPQWVPREEARGILLFDDWNRADVRIIKGLMQLFQNYRMVTWEVPKGWNIVCTGNPDNEEGYLVTSLDKAILTRMKHVQLIVDYRDWAVWAQENGVDKRAISFILKYNEMLAPQNTERTNPRSWVEAFKILKYFEDVNDKNVKEVLQHVEASVDATAANTFVTFLLQDVGLVVEPEQILEDYAEAEKKLRKLANNDRIDMIAVSTERLFLYLIDDNYKPKSKHKENLLKFIKNKFFDEKCMKDARYAFVYRLVNMKKSTIISMLTGDNELASMIAEVV